MEARKPLLCRACHKRPAKFVYRGVLKSDPKGQHDLCLQCFRAERNRQRAQALKDRDGD